MADIKGAFLKAKVPEDMELIVKIGGELAQLMCELDPTLECDEQGHIYMRCVKALYGHIEATRLFYDDLNHSIIEKMQFKKNGCDPCVYNKRTKDGAITIRVHVDDLKISAKSVKQVEYMIEQLIDIYGEITVHRGMSHDYLGMLLTYHPEEQSVTVDMQSYVEGCIEEFVQEHPEVILKEVTTPAKNSVIFEGNHEFWSDA